MNFKRFEIPHVLLGIDMLSGETSIPPGAVRDAVNVDFDRVGNAQRRSGCEPLVALNGAHSIWSSPTARGLFVCQDAVLNRFSPPSTLSPVYTLNSSDPVDFCEHDSNIYFSNSTTAGWIPADSTIARPLGVQTPAAPAAEAAVTGGLEPGRYCVSVTTVDLRGEESGASNYVFVEIPKPKAPEDPKSGGIMLTNLPNPGPGCVVRIYLSPPNGETLFLNSWVPAGMGQFLVGGKQQLKPLETAALSPLPPGEIIRALGGRIYTAKGRTLRFSQSFRFGLTALHHDYIEMDDDITIVEPVASGIYIGAGGAVWFLSGDPSKGDLRKVSSAAAIKRSSLLVSGEHFNPKTVPTDAPLALWLSAAGYVVGTSDGNVINLQADRIRIGQRTSGRTAFVLRDGHKQAITPVAAQAAAYGTANDSV